MGLLTDYTLIGTNNYIVPQRTHTQSCLRSAPTQGKCSVACLQTLRSIVQIALVPWHQKGVCLRVGGHLNTSHKLVTAAEMSLRQGAKLWDIAATLKCLCGCVELDYDICEVHFPSTLMTRNNVHGSCRVYFRQKTVMFLHGMSDACLCVPLLSRCELYLQNVNPIWDEAVNVILKDVASMPTSTWTK